MSDDDRRDEPWLEYLEDEREWDVKACWIYCAVAVIVIGFILMAVLSV